MANDNEKNTTPEATHREADTLVTAIDVLKSKFRKGERAKKGTDTLRKVAVGEMFEDPAVRNQVWVILLAVLFIVLYVAVRYQCQQDMIEIDKLETQLKDAKYRALSSSSEFTEKTRETHILKILKHSEDSMLHIPDLPPYIIQVKEEDIKN